VEIIRTERGSVAVSSAFSPPGEIVKHFDRTAVTLFSATGFDGWPRGRREQQPRELLMGHSQA
jgi:hypothetical protein